MSAAGLSFVADTPELLPRRFGRTLGIHFSRQADALWGGSLCSLSTQLSTANFTAPASRHGEAALSPAARVRTMDLSGTANFQARLITGPFVASVLSSRGLRCCPSCRLTRGTA